MFEWNNKFFFSEKAKGKNCVLVHIKYEYPEESALY